MPQINLHGYQEFAKEFIKTHKRCGLFFPMGLGKAMDDNTIMPTPDGYMRLGSLQVGDRVFDMRGEPCQIQAVYKHANKTAFKVTLEDLREFICCDEHLIPIATGNLEYDFRPVQCKDLAAAIKANPNKIYSIPRNGCVEYTARNLPVHPEVLGAIIRHGHLENNILSFDQETPDGAMYIQTIQERIGPMVCCSDGRFYFTDTVYSTTEPFSKRLIDELHDMGYVDGEPFDCIPEIYELSSAYHRCALLGQLLDIPLTAKRVNDVRFQSKQLADFITRTIRSLGFSAVLTYKPRLKVWSLSADLTGNLHEYKTIQIMSITPVSNRDMTCFTVDSPSHTYLVNDYIPTHNTLITLQALYELNPQGHVLVIAPKTIAKSTWQEEIRKWQIPIRHESFIVDQNQRELTKRQRLEKYNNLLQTPPSIWFLNRELVPDLAANLPVYHGKKVWPFPTVVIDELQSFKNPSSVRFKNMKPMQQVYDRFIGLTGTPAPQGLMDLWSEIYLMDGGERLGRTLTAYRNEFFNPTLYVNNHPVQWEPKPGAAEEIYRRIADIVISMNLRMTAPPIFNDIAVSMDAKELAMYKTLVRESCITLAGDVDVIAANRAVLQNKLTQLASGALYTETPNYQIIHEKKLDACEYIINNANDNVLVAYHFLSDKEMLLARFSNAVVFDGSLAMIQNWNAGQYPIMLIQPASAGHGINLQQGGHTLVWYTIHPNLEEYLQMNARLDRQGQQYQVIIHHILTDQTVDRRMLGLLEQKDVNERNLMDAVKVAIDMAS